MRTEFSAKRASYEVVYVRRWLLVILRMEIVEKGEGH